MTSHARALFAVLVLVQIFSGNLAVFAAKDKNTIEKTDAFAFVKADNKPIGSLVDLKDGVYSIALVGVRSECGFSTTREGMKLVHRTVLAGSPRVPTTHD